MKIFFNIPRGLIVFLGGIIVVLALILAYRGIYGGGSPAGGANTNSLFSALFPFGNPANAPSTGGAPNSNPLSQGQAGSVPVLREVSASPVSGAWFAANPASTSTPVIRYLDRESGHITATPADSTAETRVSNTTIPGIEEVYPLSDSSVVLRAFTNDAIQNLFGTIYASSSQQSLSMSALPPFARIAAEQGSSGILTVTPVSGGSRIDFSNAGANRQTLFVSPIASWVPLLAGDRTFLETAPSARADGYLYELKNGSLTKVAGGIPGFTALVSPSGRYVAYSGNSANGFSFSVLDTKTGVIFSSPLPALALKCAWVPNHEPLLFCAIPTSPAEAAYPDDWLLGNVSFSDDAWVLNPEKATNYFIGALTDAGGAGIDAERISVDPSGSFALFMNKKDLSLWSLGIGGAVARAAQ